MGAQKSGNPWSKVNLHAQELRSFFAIAVIPLSVADLSQATVRPSHPCNGEPKTYRSGYE